MVEQSGKPVLLDLRGQLAVNPCGVLAEFSANLRNLFDPVPPPLNRFLCQYFKSHLEPAFSFPLCRTAPPHYATYHIELRNMLQKCPRSNPNPIDFPTLTAWLRRP